MHYYTQTTTTLQLKRGKLKKCKYIKLWTHMSTRAKSNTQRNTSFRAYTGTVDIKTTLTHENTHPFSNTRSRSRYLIPYFISVIQIIINTVYNQILRN